MTDINDRGDIDRLMQNFYAQAMTDREIGYIFNEVARLDLDHHLPIIGDFWETLLFRTGDYQRHRRNPIDIHLDLDAKSPLRPAHFDRWLRIFRSSVDELFRGERAEVIKSRAEMIAGRMLESLGHGVKAPLIRRRVA